MIVIVDGNKIKCNQDVKIIYDDQTICDEDGEGTIGELHLTITNEGMMTDTIQDGETQQSAWFLVEDLIDECH